MDLLRRIKAGAAGQWRRNEFTRSNECSGTYLMTDTVTPMADVLYENDVGVNCLRSALSRGRSGLSQVPGLLKRIISEKMWMKRTDSRVPNVIEFKSFEEFVRTKPLEGLGADIPLLRRICAEDPEAMDLLDQVTQGQYGGDRRSEDFKIDIVNLEKKSNPNGNSQSAALRRLRKDRPDLHQRVLSKELTPHAAMIEAGPSDFNARSLP